MKLLYSIKTNEKKEIGIVYVVGCPDKDLIEKLDYYGDEGYKFYEILSAAYPDADAFEFVKIVDSVSEDSLVIPWNLVSFK